MFFRRNFATGGLCVAHQFFFPYKIRHSGTGVYKQVCNMSESYNKSSTSVLTPVAHQFITLSGLPVPVTESVTHL